MNKRMIIIGAGSSVRQGMWDQKVSQLPLWDLLKNEAHMTLNYVFRYTEPTIACSYDASYYLSNLKELEKLPLIIAANKPDVRTKVMQNTYLVPVKTKYLENQWVNGFYGSNLVGVLAISLAYHLGYKEIYCLGYDFGGFDGHTHFYEDEVDLNQKDCNQQRKYRGIGWKDRKGGDVYRCNNYNGDQNEFKPLLNYDCKIFTVGKSHLSVFPQLSYHEFHKILEEDPRSVSQSIERNEIESTIMSHVKK